MTLKMLNRPGVFQHDVCETKQEALMNVECENPQASQITALLRIKRRVFTSARSHNMPVMINLWMDHERQEYTSEFNEELKLRAGRGHYTPRTSTPLCSDECEQVVQTVLQQITALMELTAPRSKAWADLPTTQQEARMAIMTRLDVTGVTGLQGKKQEDVILAQHEALSELYVLSTLTMTTLGKGGHRWVDTIGKDLDDDLFRDNEFAFKVETDRIIKSRHIPLIVTTTFDDWNGLLHNVDTDAQQYEIPHLAQAYNVMSTWKGPQSQILQTKKKGLKEAHVKKQIVNDNETSMEVYMIWKTHCVLLQCTSMNTVGSLLHQIIDPLGQSCSPSHFTVRKGDTKLEFEDTLVTSSTKGTTTRVPGSHIQNVTTRTQSLHSTNCTSEARGRQIQPVYLSTKVAEKMCTELYTQKRNYNAITNSNNNRVADSSACER